jgi:hypothetical protein
MLALGSASLLKIRFDLFQLSKLLELEVISMVTRAQLADRLESVQVKLLLSTFNVSTSVSY